MDYNYKLGRVSATTIYILEGVVAFAIAIISGEIPGDQIMLAAASWLLGLMLLIILHVEKKWTASVFVLGQMLMTIILAVWLTIAFDSITIVLIIFLLQWISNLVYLKRTVLNTLLILQIIASIVCTYIYELFTSFEFIGILVVLFVTDGFAILLCELYKRQIEQNMDHKQSLDDLLALVEVKYSEAREANSAKSTFLANMSHEIRTPINSILGFDTMILRESKDEVIKGYASNIDSAGRSLLSIINDILDFSKIESGKMEIIAVNYDLSSVINDVNNMISVKAKEKDLEFELYVDDTIPNALQGDDVRIRQILVNLLTNAVKYTHKGKVTLSITGEIEGDILKLACSVKDTGIGIKEENIKSLFSEFVRIEEKRNRNIEGTGLGINIVTQLLKLMGSDLEVDSVYGEGSNFHFVLKQVIVDPEPIGDLQRRISEQVADYEYQAPYTIEDKRILVVDDNLMNRVIMKELLKELKCEIDDVESGKECLERVKQTKYDIIFMDHMMPEMDGVETLKAMKSFEDYPNADTPVIILTANAVAGAKEQYMADGFDDYLSKPIDPSELEKMIKKTLQI